MSLFGNKEKQEIERLNKEIETLNQSIQQLQQQQKQEVELLNQQVQQLQLQLTPEQRQIINLRQQIADLEQRAQELCACNQRVVQENEQLQGEIAAKKQNLIQLDDEILFQGFALYKPTYDFANSEQYKNRIEIIRQKQKELIKNNRAVSFANNWTVDGSLAKGKKMTNDNIKQILRTFNTECENAIDRVKFNNVDSMRSRIVKSFESLNKLNESVRVAILPTYLNLKLDELNLAIEYAIKKQDEKEEQKKLREELREQAKLEKEIEETRKRIEKEQRHFKNALQQLEKQIVEAKSDEQRVAIEEKKKEILSSLDKLDEELQAVDYREKMPKAGYVYIISNIGAFGENIYKIGMTRRLEPQERIDELGDASVPFHFDVHAMIFSEDAPKLEAALHNAFEGKKVNMMNNRKEFFNVTLDEIKLVVRDNFDKTVDFVDVPEAADYRQSVMQKSEPTAGESVE